MATCLSRIGSHVALQKRGLFLHLPGRIDLSTWTQPQLRPWLVTGIPTLQQHHSRKSNATSDAALPTSDQCASCEFPQPNMSTHAPWHLACILPDPPTKSQSSEVLFSAITLLMVLLYGIMLFAPRLRLTRRIIYSPQLLGLLAIICALSTLTACQAGLLSSIASIVHVWCTASNWVPNFAMLAHLFNSPAITLMAWVHLLMLDFYVAREVFADAARHSIPVAHSLVLCFFVGPIGLLSHALTRTLVLRLRHGR